MFGYVTVNRPELKVRDLELYRSYYCGLCAELHRRYGRKGQLLLSYDCTFIILLLTGLYEPDENVSMKRCIVHPAVVHRETSDRFTGYAADMNVLLGYMKAVDDWQDEKKDRARIMASLLRKDYLKLREKYPEQERAVRLNMQKLHREEKKLKEMKTDITGALLQVDRMAGYSGEFLAQICAPEKDMWSDSLKKTGFYLGKFIYLIDAYDDMEKDRREGNANVLVYLSSVMTGGFDDKVKEMLLDTAACCCRAFERLPIVKDAALLRNILYSGIWTRFHVIEEERKSGEKGSKKSKAAALRYYAGGGWRCGGEAL